MADNDKKVHGTFKCKAMPVLPGEEVFGEAGTGNEQIGLGILILGDCEFKNQVLPWYGYFNSPDNAKRTHRQLALLGAQMKDGDVTDLRGLGSKEAFATVETSEFEGEMRTRVSWVGTGGAVLAKPMDAQKKQALKERLKGLNLATGGSGGEAPKGGGDFPV